MSSGPRKTYWVPAADIDIDALLFYVRTRIDTEGEVKAGNHYEDKNKPGFYVRATRALDAKDLTEVKYESRLWEQEKEKHKVKYWEAKTAKSLQGQRATQTNYSHRPTDRHRYGSGNPPVTGPHSTSASKDASVPRSFPVEIATYASDDDQDPFHGNQDDREYQDHDNDRKNRDQDKQARLRAVEEFQSLRLDQERQSQPEQSHLFRINQERPSRTEEELPLRTEQERSSRHDLDRPSRTEQERPSRHEPIIDRPSPAEQERRLHAEQERLLRLERDRIESAEQERQSRAERSRSRDARDARESNRQGSRKTTTDKNEKRHKPSRR